MKNNSREMTNDEIRNPNQIRSQNDEKLHWAAMLPRPRLLFVIRHLGLIRVSDFVIRIFY
jgi:hypothetical protein